MQLLLTSSPHMWSSLEVGKCKLNYLIFIELVSSDEIIAAGNTIQKIIALYDHERLEQPIWLIIPLVGKHSPWEGGVNTRNHMTVSWILTTTIRRTNLILPSYKNYCPPRIKSPLCCPLYEKSNVCCPRSPKQPICCQCVQESVLYCPFFGGRVLWCPGSICMHRECLDRKISRLSSHICLSMKHIMHHI